MYNHFCCFALDTTKALQGVGRDTQTGQRDKLSSFAEIASCSYEARAAGLKNGMLLGKAVRDCPNLTAIPFDFEAYQAVSDKLYRILARFAVRFSHIMAPFFKLYIKYSGGKL
jgi:hypothetical protein